MQVSYSIPRITIYETMLKNQDPAAPSKLEKDPMWRPEEQTVYIIRLTISTFTNHGEMAVYMSAGTFSTERAYIILTTHRRVVGCNDSSAFVESAKLAFAIASAF